MSLKFLTILTMFAFHRITPEMIGDDSNGMRWMQCEAIVEEQTRCNDDWSFPTPPCHEQIQKVCMTLLPPRDEIVYDFNFEDLQLSDDGGVTTHSIGKPRFHASVRRTVMYFTYPRVQVLKTV